MNPMRNMISVKERYASNTAPRVFIPGEKCYYISLGPRIGAIKALEVYYFGGITLRTSRGQDKHGWVVEYLWTCDMKTHWDPLYES